MISRFMSVASLDLSEATEGDVQAKNGNGANEALMILGVAGTVGREVEAELKGEEGILDVSVVHL
jgi:hypothetical protein